jgi:hypothetical protein
MANRLIDVGWGGLNHLLAAPSLLNAEDRPALAPVTSHSTN